MRANHPLDEDTASRLLQGLVHPDDAPPGYGAAASLLNSAAQLPLGLVDEDAAATTISAMVEVIRTATPAPQIARRKSMIGKLLAGKALAAFAIAGLSVTGAAAATGSLPDPAQGVVSDAVGHVGLDIPHPDRGKSADHRQDDKGHKADDGAGDDEGQPGDDNGDDNGMSGKVAELKIQRAGNDDAGPLGQEVCMDASDGACDHADKGKSGEDHGTPSSDPGDDQENGDGHGKPEVVPPTKPETPAGSIDTGAQHSERDVPSGKGKPE